MSDNDFDIFDDIDFKALSEGLGFNQNKSNLESSKSSKSVKSPRLKTKPRLKTQNLRTSSLPEVHLNLQEAVAHSTSFNKTDVLSAKEIRENQKIQEVGVESINVLRKVFSWLLDLSFILSLVALSLMAVNYFVYSKTSIITLSDAWNFNEFTLFSFFAYYIFYFSLLWKTTGQTLGMSLMGLKIHSTIDPQMSFTQSIVRSFLSIISACSFGITDIIGLTNSLSWTRLESK